MKYEVTGRNKTSLRSHSLAFLNQQPAALALPRVVEPSEYYVIFANLNDSERACQTKSRLLIRKQVTNLLCPLYRANIDLYQKVPESDFFTESEIEKILPNSFDDGNESTLIQEAEVPSMRPGQVTRMQNVEVRTSAAFLGATPAGLGEGTPTFKVTRSSNCMNCRSRDYELAAFPDLHSNGLGTVYDTRRVVKVGAKEGRRHLLSLSLRTFAQHPIWTLVNIDNTNKEIGQGLMSVSLERDPNLALAGCQLSQSEVQDLLEHQYVLLKLTLALQISAVTTCTTLKNLLVF